MILPDTVIGSITGVRLLINTFPEVGFGPRLTVDIHHGALTEGVSKLALHILGSDLTGGCMNPAAVMGWAYARGDHITKEHILVYWLAPMEATLLAVWTFRLLVQPHKEEKEKMKAKSE
ncbi:putative aquaporin SIP2-1 [Vitis vinifera]|uniref:Putative aquaporin SIP2-1 n=1 Tax=Vitis vinifera TaxID=29760 RepID=A0A438BXR3_VITVI|nr:putative aquaporin SIP2-1 [Vitis vinifera]